MAPRTVPVVVVLSLFLTCFSSLPVFAAPADFSLPHAEALADGRYPWISATPYLWKWSLDFLKDRDATLRPLDRNRMRELGRLSGDGRLKGVHVGETETFWVMNMVTRQPERVEAVLRKIGKHCYMYVEPGHEVMTDALVDKLCRQFDEIIYPTDTGYFGKEWKPGIDWDERITLLFLDIKDGWEPGKGYVGGFFFPLNEYSNRIFAYSNEREMVYLDLYPSNPTGDDYLGVLAHEFQHLIHWYHDKSETRWLNEAASQIAFYVNGYGHAPQTFQFVQHGDTGMEEFDNGIDDYGCVYSFFYYLFSKYAGDSVQDRMDFFSYLCDDSEKGLASVRDTLTHFGIQKPLEDIFIDWCVANMANGTDTGNPLWTYDPSFTLRVEPEARYAAAALPVDGIKGEVQPWAADYITVTPKCRWEPYRPTMVDHVTLVGDGPGKIEWTINGGALPPQALIPEGSSIEGDHVTTRLKQDEDGRWTAVIGRFVKLGVFVSSLDVTFTGDGGRPESYRIPVFSIDTLAKKSLEAFHRAEDGTDGGLRFRFDGKKGKPFHLYAMVETGRGCRIETIPLDSQNHAEFTFGDQPDDLKELTFMVAATDGKKFKYEYSIDGSLDARGTDLLDTIARLRDLQNGVEGELFGKVAGKADELEAALARSIARGGPALERITADFASSGAARRDRLAPVLRRVFRRARQRILDKASGGAGDLLEAASELIDGKSLSTAADVDRSDDQDDSHDNLGYLTWKKMELIHALTHLKIDPKFVEGQLIEIWTTLQISQGFPDLPIPDGLNIADFDDQAALDILKQWSEDFGLSYPFPDGGGAPETRPVPYTSDIEKVKRICRRLILAESIVEFCYNQSLTMADDMALAVYDFVRLVMTAKSAIDDIAEHFSHVPVAGAVLKKVVTKIHGMLVRLVQKFAAILAAKLPAPYGSIAPVLVPLVSWAYARFMHLELPPSSDQHLLMETGAKLLAKYALTATPRIGYVAKGQAAVDKAAECAAAMVDEGGFDEAFARVWDDGDPNTATSIREQVAGGIATRHQQAQRNRKIANVGKKLMEILQYSALIDPTNISKVLAVVSGLASTGVLSQICWTSGRYFFDLPGDIAVRGAEMAYRPSVQEDATEGTSTQSSSAPDRTAVSRLLRGASGSLRRFSELAEKARVAAENRDAVLFERLMDELLDEEDVFDEMTTGLEAVFFAGRDVRTGERGRDLLGLSQAALLERASILAGLASAFCQGEKPEDIGLSKTRTYKEALAARILKAGPDCTMDPVIAVTRIDTTRTDGGRIEVSARVVNLSGDAVDGVKAILYSALSLDVDGSTTQELGRLEGGEEREVTFIFTDKEPGPVELPTFAVAVEARGALGLAGMSCY